jgi:hypothetical protein
MRKKLFRLSLVLLGLHGNLILSSCSSLSDTSDAPALDGRWKLIRMECQSLNNSNQVAAVSSPILSQLNLAIQRKRYFSLIRVNARTVEYEQRVFPITDVNGFCETVKVAKLSEDPRSSFSIKSEKIVLDRIVGLQDRTLCPRAEDTKTPRTSDFRLNADGELRTFLQEAPRGLCDPGLQLISIFERIL